MIRKADVMCPVLFLVVLLSLPLSLRKLTEAIEIRSAPISSVAITSKFTRALPNPTGHGAQAFEFVVAWVAPVGRVHSATALKEQWDQIRLGDRVGVAITPDGNPHLRGGPDDDVGSMLSILGISAAVLLACGYVLQRRWFRPPYVSDEYLTIGTRSRIGSALWEGPVIASRQAIYVLKQSETRFGENPVSDTIGGAISSLLPKSDLTTGNYSSIPQSVRDDPTWPVSPDTTCAVIIVPRNEIEVIQHPYFNNVIETSFRDLPICLIYNVLYGRRIRDRLAALGWPLIWGSSTYNGVSPTKKIASNDSTRRARYRITKVSLGIAAALGIFAVAYLYGDHKNHNMSWVDLAFVASLVGIFIALSVGMVALMRGV